MDGPMDLPGSYAFKLSVDVVEIDLQALVKRIASDLIRSTRPRSPESVTFGAKFFPGTIDDHAVTPHSVQSWHNLRVPRLGGSRLAV
jgi:hypothetical protein